MLDNEIPVSYTHLAGVPQEDEETEGTFTEPAESAVSKTLEMTIEDLDLSVRSYNCLKRAGINTVAELAQKSEEDMMKMCIRDRYLVDLGSRLFLLQKE